MTRIGFADKPENVEEIKKISELPNLEIEGMFTHFARADETDKAPAMVQLKRYLRFADASGKGRSTYSAASLLQQCGNHTYAGSKSEMCPCRNHHLWYLSVR